MRLRRSVHPLHCVGELIGAWDGLHDNVLVLDTGGFEGFAGAREEGLDDFRVPPAVDDANAEVRACAGKRGESVMRPRIGVSVM